MAKGKRVEILTDRQEIKEALEAIENGFCRKAALNLLPELLVPTLTVIM